MKTCLNLFSGNKSGKVILVFCVSVLILTVFGTYYPYKEKAIFDSVIRIHILANAENSYDMAIKYAVRNALLNASEFIFSEAGDIEDAKADIDRFSDYIKSTSDKVLSLCGVEYKTSIIFGKENYPTCYYEDFALPAGEYYSLRVVLGEGNGSNWWCVFFPSICLKASSAKDELKQAGLSSDSSNTFTSKKPKYRIRFKFLEWFGMYR